MSILKRMKDIFVGNTHKVLDSIEDKIQTYELRIREAHEQIKVSKEAYAKIYAEEKLLEANISEKKELIEQYNSRLKTLKEEYLKTNDEKYSSAIKKLLSIKNVVTQELEELTLRESKQEQLRKAHEASLKKLESIVLQNQREITTLKSQSQAAKANKEISKALNSFDVNSMDNDMGSLKDQVKREIAESEAYLEMVNKESEMDEIDRVLNETNSDDEFEKFMNS